jgi:GDP-L-fucose synthase
LIGRSSTELDLTDRTATFDFYEQERPEYVILAAAKVGGILANSAQPADFLSENVRIQEPVFKLSTFMADSQVPDPPGS